MRLTKLDDIDDLNNLKMKLFNRISLDKWQIFYTSIYPAIIRQEILPSNQLTIGGNKKKATNKKLNVNKKVLFFSAQYLSGEILLNPKLVSNY